MSDDSQLNEAIEHGYAIVKYASEKGVDIGSENVKVLVQARKSISGMGCDDEVLFWKTLAAATEKIKPATIESLLSSSDQRIFLPWSNNRLSVRVFSSAKRSVFYYTFGTILCLFGLVFFQLYSFIGITAINEIKQYEQQTKDILAQIDLAAKKDMSDDEKRKRMANFEESRRRLEDEIKARVTILHEWNDIVISAFTFEKSTFKDKNASDSASDAGPQGENVCQSDAFIGMTEQTEATLTIAAINNYIMPFIFGLLGVCAYILRDLSAKIKENSYVKRNNIGYRLRWPLGALAGASFGYLLKPESMATLSSNLTPYGIAFVMGYSVEVLFRILDVIIEKLTFKNPQEAKTGT